MTSGAYVRRRVHPEKTSEKRYSINVQHVAIAAPSHRQLVINAVIIDITDIAFRRQHTASEGDIDS